MTAMLVPLIGAPLAITGLVAGTTLKATGHNIAFGLINPAQITLTEDLVMTISDTIFDNIYMNPKINLVHVIEEDIVAKKQIVFIGLLSKITKADAGCNTSPQSTSITMSEKFWNPAPVKYWLQQCANDLETSFFVWSLKKGIERKDLEDTDFAAFIIERMETALAEDMLRIVWFNDLDAAHYNDSPAGVITNGVDITDYNIIEGLWEQIYAAVALNSARKTVAITKNAGVTYALQAFDATDTTNKVVHSYLQSVIDNADTRLSEQESDVILVTKSVFDQYKKELKTYTAILPSYEMVLNGVPTSGLTFDGIPIIRMDLWDRTIRADYDNGTVWYKPHRILFTVKENIPVGVDGMKGASSFSSFYLPKEETTNWKGAYKIDTKLLKEYLFATAY